MSKPEGVGARVSIVWVLFRALGPAKENIYALESPKGYIVSGCWELKRKFRVNGCIAIVSTANSFALAHSIAISANKVTQHKTL
jgi:hypothetical protein